VLSSAIPQGLSPTSLKQTCGSSLGQRQNPCSKVPQLQVEVEHQRKQSCSSDCNVVSCALTGLKFINTMGHKDEYHIIFQNRRKEMQCANVTEILPVLLITS